MRLLNRNEEESINSFLRETIEVAKKATCGRSKCGAIIVKDGIIIGKGFNSPPKELESQRRCLSKKSEYDLKVTDKTCCIHAEQRAMFDTLKLNSEEILGSILYFIRLDEKNEIMYGYNIESVAELNNKMEDDIKVLLYEYRAAFKNKNKADRKN